MTDRLAFLKRPWAITLEAFEILAGFDLDRCDESPALHEISPEDFDEYLEINESNGIAVLSISGPLMQSPSLMARFFMGAADLDRIETLIREAQASPNVRALVLRMNTPGGTVSGTPEAANAVRDFAASGKPVFAFSNGSVCSAGYWIAAPATELVGTESSQWGSVGVIRPHVDLSEARKREGIKVELFTSGKHKGAGALNTSLSDEQREAIQSEIAKLGAKFRVHVKSHRAISDADLEALTYYADEAKARGYVDRVVANFDELLQDIEGQLNASNSRRSRGASVDTVTASETNGDTAALEMKTDTQDTDTATEDELDTGSTEGADETTTDETGASGSTDGDTAEGGETGTQAGATVPGAESVDPALASALARIAALETELKGFDDRVEAVAARRAARIAAESSTDAADVTSSGDDGALDETRFASMGTDALWSEYEKLRASHGDAKASDFYQKHIKGRA